MTDRVLNGNWPTVPVTVGGVQRPAFSFADGSNASNGLATPGLVRVSPVPVTPSVVEHWTVLGWSVRLSMLYNLNGSQTAGMPPCAKLGKLWGGLAIGSQQRDQGGWIPTPGGGMTAIPGRGVLPADLSTFDVVWTQDDDVGLSNWDFGTQQIPASAVPFPVGHTYMLPAPIGVLPSTQLQMQLVQMPGVYMFLDQLVCVDASWSLIIDDGKP